MIEIIKPDFTYEDDRGSLIQLVHYGYKQVNIIKSVRGAIRGGHYHKNNSEVFFIISGKLRLKCWHVNKENNKDIKSFLFEKGSMFKIEPFVGHEFEFLEDTILASLYDKGIEYDDGGKDIISI